MASQKHLKDLLREDQEPFQLQSYISDRRCQIKRPLSPRRNLQVRKRKPISQNAGFPSRFYRNACFFSFRESPDPRMSPLFEFQSPSRSPNAIFQNIPAKTSAFLLEAAVRIQKQSSSEGSKTRTRNAGNAFALFGSVLRKLTNRKKRDTGGDNGGRVSVKDILRWESPVLRRVITGNAKHKGVSENAVAINEGEKSTSGTRRSSSSGVWSEGNEERSWDCGFETSSSSISDGQDEFTFDIMDDGDFTEDHEKRFCESPFRFVLVQASPSPRGGFRTPNFASPAASPSRRGRKSEEGCEREKLQMEEEKEQDSPVSVLDPPFQDDDEDVHIHVSLQRTKHQLLQNLRRFEKLASLDPVQLENQMLSSDQETGEEATAYNNVDDKEDEATRYYHQHCEELTRIILENYLDEPKQIPQGIPSLISDIVADEVQENGFLIDVAKRVCERLESWRGVEPNTIDMMVEQDFTAQSFVGLWAKNDQEAAEISMEIEFEIFRCLVEELSEELIQG
ncbi:PREDICTED: uncharacterized protein LOC104826931 [Tarenaya hassleriana]|uniref:uncharacterized protein LOC104826931 n=1 Tax=Tarenaya hassleriana TaxID=28532 RepID=UPI00053C7B73|nr:PREDICTED: uncharacterized protein LOC104826931 [Tarenaya hassleriana]